MSQYPGEHVEVWQQPDGMWRWKWLPRREEREKVPDIVSAKAFPGPEDAQETASEAYPELPVVVVDKTPEQKRRSKRMLALVLLGGLLTVLLWHRRPPEGAPAVALRVDRHGPTAGGRGRGRQTFLLRAGSWRLTRE